MVLKGEAVQDAFKDSELLTRFQELKQKLKKKKISLEGAITSLNILCLNFLWDFGQKSLMISWKYNFEDREKPGIERKDQGVSHWCVNNIVGTWRIPQSMIQD